MILLIKDVVQELLLQKCEDGIWHTHKGQVCDGFRAVENYEYAELENVILNFLYQSPIRFVVNKNLNEFICDIVYELKIHLNDGQGSDIYEQLRKFEQ
jgi:hypothetical protein